VRTLLIVSLLAAVAGSGCKSKPKRKAPPANVSAPGNATPGAQPGQPAPDLELPHSDGGPPKKTTTPHMKADYERLSKLTYPGFGVMVRTVGDKVFEVRQITNGHPRYWVTITIQHCLDCVPMELEKWKAKTEDLKVLLGALKDTPGVTFEVGQTHVNGQPVMYTYQFGAGGTGSDSGGMQSTFTDAYAAYYNDGVNQIRVVAEFKDDPRPLEELAKIAPKTDLQMLALAFMDVYTHAW
jgi:hypothetical protein